MEWFRNEIAAEVIHCIAVLAAVIFPGALILTLIRFLTRIPSFVFRKLMHILAFSGVSLTLAAAKNARAAALAFFLTGLMIWPVLCVLEKEKWYPKLVTEKWPGEVRKSLFMFFLMLAALTAAVWGFFREQYLAVTAILMWGTGDAAAALVGIPFGKHKVKSRLTDGKKSWEGSAAMLAVSFLTGAAMLLLVRGLSAPAGLVCAVAAALAGTAAELVSPTEFDTITVPAVVAAVLLLA